MVQRVFVKNVDVNAEVWGSRWNRTKLYASWGVESTQNGNWCKKRKHLFLRNYFSDKVNSFVRGVSDVTVGWRFKAGVVANVVRSDSFLFGMKCENSVVWL